MYNKIVVGTDLSETSKIAVRHAAALAEKVGASLVLVHAGNDPGEPLKELAADVGAEVAVAQGSPADVLLSLADEHHADLLVVGSVGMSGAKRFALGNVPNKISHHADRDLMIVKTDTGDRPAAFKKILVGTDGSATSMRAVEMASRLANSLGTVPTIVTVYEPPSEHELEQLRSGATADAISAWHATKEQRETPADYQWRIAGAAQAEDILERAAHYAGKFDVEPELRAVEGSPAECLLEIAASENFDLICVGSVGMSGTSRFMLGNVPHRLSHHTPTNILILNTKS